MMTHRIVTIQKGAVFISIRAVIQQYSLPHRATPAVSEYLGTHSMCAKIFRQAVGRQAGRQCLAGSRQANSDSITAQIDTPLVDFLHTLHHRVASVLEKCMHVVHDVGPQSQLLQKHILCGCQFHGII
jgi:hypothetical protein